LTGPREAEFVQAQRCGGAVRRLQDELPEVVAPDVAGVPLAEVRPALDAERVVVRRGRRASVVAREVVPAQPQGQPDARQSAQQVRRALAVPREREARQVPERASPRLVQDGRALERQVQERREE